MENNNDSTPVTCGSATPTVPVGSGWNPMGGYYNMYPWPGMMPGMAPGGSSMPGMPGMAPGGSSMPVMPGCMPGMQMMPGWHPGVQGLQPGMPGVMPGMPGGDNVYRPTLDFLTASSHTSTPVETQFTGDDTFSLEELLDQVDRYEDTPIHTGEVGRGRGRGAPKKRRGKGKGPIGESSQPADDDNVRRKWTDEENLALSKAWMNVCDDPLHSTNQRIVNLWAKIAAAYNAHCPHGKQHNGEDCRKQWDRIRSAVSRFAGLYANNDRMKTSGQTDDDVRRIAESQFPLKGVYKEFTFWNCYEVLMDSEKFRAGVDAGWPKKQRLNLAGDHSSSGGSHELPDDAQEFPSPPSFTRRTRPVGQRTAQRARSRGLAQGSQEVQSASPSTAELADLARQQTAINMWKIVNQWKAADDPVEKGFLYEILQSMQADLARARRARGDEGGSAAPDLGIPGSGDGGDEE